jgi:hypothetical protein
MTPKTRKIFSISVITLGIIAAIISVDYYYYKKPTFIECSIDPIAELPTVEKLLIRISPTDYLLRLLSRLRGHDQNFIEADLWWNSSRIWGITETPSALLNDSNPLRELALARTRYGMDGSKYATPYKYEWNLLTADPNNGIRIPSQDGHIYTFNHDQVNISREDGSYTEIIRNFKTDRNPRDELTVHGKCKKAQAPAKAPSKQVL